MEFSIRTSEERFRGYRTIRVCMEVGTAAFRHVSFPELALVNTFHRWTPVRGLSSRRFLCASSVFRSKMLQTSEYVLFGIPAAVTADCGRFSVVWRNVPFRLVLVRARDTNIVCAPPSVVFKPTSPQIKGARDPEERDRRAPEPVPTGLRP